MLLPEKISISNCPVILYELIPPIEKIGSENLIAYANCAVELLESSPVVIDGINIPEIRDEKKDSSIRAEAFFTKSDSREFAQQLQKSSRKHLEFVINHCTVYEEWSAQHGWLRETETSYGIKNLILVGGESSQIRYPGASVNELSLKIKESFPSFFCGGITIPSRRSDDPQKDELNRLVDKGKNGLEYFTTQVIYEPFQIQQLLKDYDLFCKQTNIKPKRIFLSFAPISAKKDLQFLRWLGVVIPKAVEKMLFEADIGIGWRSMKISKVILQRILTFVLEKNIEVPLGLNIEHISRHNFELSREFISVLGPIYTQMFDLKYLAF